MHIIYCVLNTFYSKSNSNDQTHTVKCMHSCPYETGEFLSSLFVCFSSSKRKKNGINSIGIIQCNVNDLCSVFVCVCVYECECDACKEKPWNVERHEKKSVFALVISHFLCFVKIFVWFRIALKKNIQRKVCTRVQWLEWSRPEQYNLNSLLFVYLNWIEFLVWWLWHGRNIHTFVYEICTKFSF